MDARTQKTVLPRGPSLALPADCRRALASVGPFLFCCLLIKSDHEDFHERHVVSYVRLAHPRARGGSSLDQNPVARARLRPRARTSPSLPAVGTSERALEVAWADRLLPWRRLSSWSSPSLASVSRTSPMSLSPMRVCFSFVLLLTPREIPSSLWQPEWHSQGSRLLGSVLWSPLELWERKGGGGTNSMDQGL